MTGIHSPIMIALAGIAMFMYGLSLTSDNLQKLASNRIRDIMTNVTQKPLLGIIAGVGLTLSMQSSGAVTSMLVGLGTAGVVSLTQTMSLILGSAIGTTFTVQLLSFKIAEYGLPLFTVFFGFYFLAKRKALKQIYLVFMGFGLIFWGLELIGIGTQSFRNIEVFSSILTGLKQDPLIAIAATAIFTAVVHSSAVTIGFAMSLVNGGLIDFNDALFWVYGANIGTTATALVVAVGGNQLGRQIAWANCLVKVLGVGLIYHFTIQMAPWFEQESTSRAIANFHTIFNIALALVFLPLIPGFVRFIEFLIPKGKGNRPYGVKYIKRAAFSSPSMALAHAEREALRMTDLVVKMVKSSILLLESKNEELEEKIHQQDDKVDHLNREIKLYLSGLLEEGSEEVNEHIIRVMMYIADVESAADVIDRNIMSLSEKKHALKLEFSEEGWSELYQIHKLVTDLAVQSMGCFQTQDPIMAEKALAKKREIRRLEKDLRQSHILRLAEGRTESINTSSIHIDTLSEYRRISGLFCNHIHALLEDRPSDDDEPV